MLIVQAQALIDAGPPSTLIIPLTTQLIGDAEPLRLRVRFSRVAPGVFDEAIMPSDVLQLTGQATVHGTFRKWIFSVKRSIDITIDETRENPIAAYHPLKLALAEIRRLESMGFSLPFGE